MYHQFKELAGIDITAEPMEIGPTTHYVMGGVRRSTATRRCRRCRDLFAAGECAAGINGANRLGGNSLSDLLVFGKRAGEHAAAFAKANGPAAVDERRSRPRSSGRSRRSSGRRRSENPFKIQQDLQGMMQDLVGIVRQEDEMQRALGGARGVEEARRAVRRDRPPRVSTPAGTPRRISATC